VKPLETNGRSDIAAVVTRLFNATPDGEHFVPLKYTATSSSPGAAVVIFVNHRGDDLKRLASKPIE